MFDKKNVVHSEAITTEDSFHLPDIKKAVPRK